DDRGLWALVTDFQLECTIHVHDDRFQVGAALRAEKFKEGPNIFPSPTPAHPQDPLASRLHNHGRGAVASVDSKFVYGDDLDAREVDGTQGLLQRSLVDGLDGLPSQTEDIGDVL